MKAHNAPMANGAPRPQAALKARTLFHTARAVPSSQTG